jgi:hypothetical protein
MRLRPGTFRIDVVQPSADEKARFGLPWLLWLRLALL